MLYGDLSTSYEKHGRVRSKAMSVVSYILSVQEKLAKMSELVGENAARAKAQQKKWYDQNARSQEFHPGSKYWCYSPVPPANC